MFSIEQILQRTTDTKALMICEGAIRKTPEIFRELFGDSAAVVVSDAGSYAAAGVQVQDALEASGIRTVAPYVFTDPDIFAEWGYLEQLETYLRTNDAIPVAVGSGVMNDLTKLASHHIGRRYIIVGTAASMDGYTAYGASITLDGNKQTFECPAPLGVIFDPAVAAGAPEGMSASGYADLLAKVPAGADWMIAEAAGAEAVDEFSFQLVQEPLRASLSEPDAVAAGEVAPTMLLAEGLIMSGFAMQALQSSRPASGLEHQFSHYWDMEGLCYPDGRHVSHGFKVAIGTLASTACLEFLLGYDIAGVDVDRCVEAWPTWDEQRKEIERVFDGMPGHLSRALVESKAKYRDKDSLRKQLEALKSAWPALSGRIRQQIYTLDEVRDLLRRVRAPYESDMICVTKERFGHTFDAIPYMRSRFTCIDMIMRMGLLQEARQYLVDRGLML